MFRFPGRPGNACFSSDGKYAGHSETSSPPLRNGFTSYWLSLRFWGGFGPHQVQHLTQHAYLFLSDEILVSAAALHLTLARRTHLFILVYIKLYKQGLA